MSPSENEKYMERRDFLKIGAAAAAAAAIGPLGLTRVFGEPAPGKKPNIVFVFSDEHRWCSLPFTEMPRVIAPNMEKLAKQGMRFDNCCSSSPICVPYRAMLMTGQWPHQSGYVSNDYFVPGKIGNPGAPTLAQTFKKAGYVTGYVGKWHLKNETVYDAGFDYFKHWLYGDNHWETQVRDVPSKEEFKTVKGYNAIGMTDQALSFVNKEAKGDKPFFLMLSINPPHWRWDDAPEEFVKLYSDDKILPYRKNVQGERYYSEREKNFYRHYHAHITAVDRELGRIMDDLKKQGLDENTILIYTSDHGSSFGSNGVGSKGNPFDEAVRVPFIIRWPGHIRPDTICDANMGAIDLYPTLCGLAGITPPKSCGGVNFAPRMLGKKTPDPETQFLVVNNFRRHYFRRQLGTPNNKRYFAPYRAVRSKQYTFAVGEDGDWLLFDNKNDPTQLKNMVDDPQYAAVKEKLRKELDAWLKKAEDPYIPKELQGKNIPDRIAKQSEYYTLILDEKRWDAYKAKAVAPYIRQAPGKEKQLRAAADEVLGVEFFGPYLALQKAVNDKPNRRRRITGKPVEEFKPTLAALEKEYAAKLKKAAEKIINKK